MRHQRSDTQYMFVGENLNIIEYIKAHPGSDRHDIAEVVGIDLDLANGKGAFDSHITQIKKVYERRGDECLVCVDRKYYILTKTSPLFKRLYPEVVESTTKQIEGRSKRLRKLAIRV